MPTLNGIEARLDRIVISRGFLVSFICATILSFGAGILFVSSLGIGSISLPLLAWMPFLLLINAHMAAGAIQRIRSSKAPILFEISLPILALGVTGYLLYSAIRILSFAPF